jgi:transposase
LILPYKEYIRTLLRTGNPSASAIHREILKKGGYMSLSTVSKAVKSIKYELDMSAIRYETTPGVQAQADWADFPGFSVNINGKERNLHAFFLILGYSRMRYVEFVTEMKTQTLINCMEHAFQYFGGVSKEVLFDNMPQVVNRCINPLIPGSMERELVPEFTAFADYYGFDIELARIRRPQQKGKVERFVRFFKKNFIEMLEKKTNHNLEDLNSRALDWCNRVNSQIHETTHEIPFTRLIQEGLKDLPEINYYDNQHFKVYKDGSVFFQGHVYRLDESLAGCEGEIIDLNNVIFANIEGQYLILAKRDLPVYIRRRYSETKQTAIKQKNRKNRNTIELNRWIKDKTKEFIIDWSNIYERYV